MLDENSTSNNVNEEDEWWKKFSLFDNPEMITAMILLAIEWFFFSKCFIWPLDFYVHIQIYIFVSFGHFISRL